MSVLEAMKAGLVPVASKLSAGISEMIDDGESGFLVPIGDSRAMASRIALLAADRNLLATMSITARLVSMERFESRKCADSMTAAIFAARPHITVRGDTPHYLSRMDRAWIPNPVVKATRALLRVARSRS